MPPKIKVFPDRKFKDAEPELYTFITGITGGKIPGGAMDYNRIYKIFIGAITPENRDMILEHVDRYNRFLHNKDLHKWIFDPRILNNDFLEILLRHYRKESEKETTTWTNSLGLSKEARKLQQVDRVFFCDLLNNAVVHMKKLYLDLFPTHIIHLVEPINGTGTGTGAADADAVSEDKSLLAVFDDISHLYHKNTDILELWLMECPHHSILLEIEDIYELFVVVLKEFYGEGAEESHDDDSSLRSSLQPSADLRSTKKVDPTRVGKLAFIEKVLTLQKKKIDAMVDAGHFEIIFCFIRLFAKYDQNELVQFFFDLFPHLFIYDNAFDVICQRKSINIDFILPILKRFQEYDYREFPRYHIEDDSIMYLINKGNEEATISFINMIQTLNYISYLSFAIEKRQFAVVDYIFKTIIFYENQAILGTPYFMKKIEYTTLFYEEEDYERLGAVFGKYGIADKIPSRENFNMVKVTGEMVKGSEDGSGTDLSCQICIEDGKEGESLLGCKKCHKLFHRECIYQWIESKKIPTFGGAGGEGAEFEAELVLEDDADWEDVQEEDGDMSEQQDDEEEDGDSPRRSPRLANKGPISTELEESDSDDSDDSDYSDNGDDDEDDDEDEDEEKRKLIDQKICIISQHYPTLKCVHCQCHFSK